MKYSVTKQQVRDRLKAGRIELPGWIRDGLVRRCREACREIDRDRLAMVNATGFLFSLASEIIGKKGKHPVRTTGECYGWLEFADDIATETKRYTAQESSEP